MTYSTPQLHALMILYTAREPMTQERLTGKATAIGFQDTPQSLRSRLTELERKGLVQRVDRTGISRYNRPCWRWQITKEGREVFD